MPDGNFSRPIYGDFSLSASLDGKDEKSIDAALLKIFKAVYEAGVSGAVMMLPAAG